MSNHIIKSIDDIVLEPRKGTIKLNKNTAITGDLTVHKLTFSEIEQDISTYSVTDEDKLTSTYFTVSSDVRLASIKVLYSGDIQGCADLTASYKLNEDDEIELLTNSDSLQIYGDEDISSSVSFYIDNDTSRVYVKLHSLIGQSYSAKVINMIFNIKVLTEQQDDYNDTVYNLSTSELITDNDFYVTNNTLLSIVASFLFEGTISGRAELKVTVKNTSGTITTVNNTDSLQVYGDVEICDVVSYNIDNENGKVNIILNGLSSGSCNVKINAYSYAVNV